MGSMLSKADPAVAMRQACFREVRKLGVTTTEFDSLYGLAERSGAVAEDGVVKLQHSCLLIGLEPDSPQQSPAQVMGCHIFDIFDRKGLDHVKLEAYFETLVMYCAFTRCSLIKLAFALLDRNDNKTVEANEIPLLVQDLRLDPSFNHELAHGFSISNIHATWSSPEDTVRLTELAFTQFALANPVILYPAACVQATLRQGVLGEEWWERMTALRDPTVAAATLTWTRDLVQCALDGGLVEALGKCRTASVHMSDLASPGEARDVAKEFKVLFSPNRALTMAHGMSRQASSLGRSIGRISTRRLASTGSMREMASSPGPGGSSRSLTSYASFSNGSASPGRRQAQSKVAPA